MNAGDKIKQLRLDRGLTLEEVGQLVGVGKSTVRKWETGAIANMRRDKIAKLADALGIDPMDIINMYEHDDPAVVSPLPAPALTDPEQRLLDNYRDLNDAGRDKLMDYAEDLVLSGRYEKASSPSMSSAG